MAASGAHVTSAVTEASAPSIFEVLAQERLTSLIQPAISHVTNVIFERYPVLATFVNPEKIGPMTYAILETHFLMTHNASAGEHFYGLERVNPDGSLTKLDKLRSLLVLTALPGLKNYVDKKQRSPGIKSKFWRKIDKIYPYACAGIQTMDFVLSIRYLLGKTQYQSLEQLLTGTVLQRAKPKFLQKAKGRFGRALNAASTALTYSITAAVFFVQFLQWWQQQKRGTEHNANDPVPPPPEVSHDIQNGFCALCQEEVKNATVLSTSGFVFCYPCIYNQIASNGTCPITGYPSSLDNLIRLHSTGS